MLSSDARGPEALAQRVQRRARRPAAQHLDHRLVGRQRLLVEAAVEHGRAVVVRARRELGHAAGLADPRVAGEQDERALALQRLAPAALQVGELDGAADERVPVDRGGQRCRPRRGLPRTGGRDGRDRAVHGRRLAAQDALEDGHRRRARRRAELLAQQRAQLLEGAQRLGGVARGLVDLHQQPVRGLAERRRGDRRARGLLGRPELAPTLAQPRFGERLQRAQADRLQLAALLGRPAALGVGQEGLQVGGERLARVLGRPLVIAGLHRALGVEDRGAGGLDVHAHVVEAHAQLAAAGQHALAQRAPQLRQQRAQRRVRRGRRTLGPQHVDELVARAPASTIQHQVGEEQAALPPRQPSVQSAPVRRPPGRGRTTGCPSRHPPLSRDAIGSPRFLQGFIKRRSASFSQRRIGTDPSGAARTTRTSLSNTERPLIGSADSPVMQGIV